MTTPATDANPSLGPVFPGYDPTNHYKNVAVQVGPPTQDSTTGVWYGPLAVDVTVSVDPASNQRVNTQAGDIAAGSAVSGAFVAGAIADLSTLPASLTELLGDTDNLALLNTNTAPLIASGAGGYIRQDSTATMAKESGGNLATLAGAISGGKMLTNMALLNGTAPLVETLGAMAGGFVTEDVIRNFTLAGKAFSATTGKNAAPGAVTLGFQLFNPANSGKNLLIYSLIILSAAAGIHDIRMTTADVSSITGWSGNNVAVTPVNNKGGGAGSSATCGYSNTSVTGTLLGSSRETTACTANAPVEVLTNGECIFLPAAASINGLAVYFNATGTNNWAITCEYLEF